MDDKLINMKTDLRSVRTGQLSKWRSNKRMFQLKATSANTRTNIDLVAAALNNEYI